MQLVTIGVSLGGGLILNSPYNMFNPIITVPTPPPTPKVDLLDKAYYAINNGSFAVILVATMAMVYGKRSISTWLNSPLARALVESVDQIRLNQEHIKTLVVDIGRLDKTTEELVTQMAELQRELEQSGHLSRQAHATVLSELKNIRDTIKNHDH